MSENSYDTRSRASVSSYAGQSYQQVWDPLAQLHILDLLVVEIQQFNVLVVGTPKDLVNLTEHLSASHSLNMVFKVIVVSLLVACLSYTHGATIPDQILNQVLDFLVNPEPLAAAVDMRV